MVPKRRLKILMFGWEFPPFNSGGLGVACQGLVGALARRGIEITFVLPRRVDCQSNDCRFAFADSSGALFNVRAVDSILSPYLRNESYGALSGRVDSGSKSSVYSDDLIGEVMRYADAAQTIVGETDFDIIHAHDWLSLPAGIMAKKNSGKPLIFQIHATEFDRVGNFSANRRICEIEQHGIKNADRVIAVSEYTKRRILQFYDAKKENISVVPNAVNVENFAGAPNLEPLKKLGAKIVLFVGRLTFQKGPDYFLRAAKMAAGLEPKAYFMISGAGDMERWLIAESARLGLSDRVFFTGFLRGEDLARAYKMADLYVMPSVSDPFGITALESLASGTPVLVSKQTGASEMLSHCLKVDFWDINQMAAKIVALLRYPELRAVISQNAYREVVKFDWNESARRCAEVYNEIAVC